MNIKNKKILSIVVGVVAVVGLVGGMLFNKINEADNEYVTVTSTLNSLKQNIIQSKDILLLLQEKMTLINKDSTKLIVMGEIIDEMEKSNYFDEGKVNDYVKQIDKFNNELDEMMDMYNNDENMKKDMTITNNIEEIIGLDIFIKSVMDIYNKEEAPAFNESIKKFPVTIVADKKGWSEVDKFSSIK